MRETKLPPGPRVPAAIQTVGFWTRPTAGIDRLRARYGSRITTRLVGQPTTIVLSDPDDIKAVLLAPPDVLHPGEGARLLEPIVGPHSVILLDEAPHLEQRKLLLPAFHGEKMQALAGLIEALTEREIVTGVWRFITEAEQVAFTRLVVSESRQRPWIAEDFYRAGKEPLAKNIAACVRAMDSVGTIRCARPEVAARQFLGLVQEFILWPDVMAITGLVADNPDLATVTDDSVQMFLSMYGR